MFVANQQNSYFVLELTHPGNIQYLNYFITTIAITSFIISALLLTHVSCGFPLSVFPYRGLGAVRIYNQTDMCGRGSPQKHSPHIRLAQCSLPLEPPCYRYTAYTPVLSLVSPEDRRGTWCTLPPAARDLVCKISRRSTEGDRRATGPAASRQVFGDRANTKNLYLNILKNINIIKNLFEIQSNSCIQNTKF